MADGFKKPWQTKENPSDKKALSNKIGSRLVAVLTLFVGKTNLTSLQLWETEEVCVLGKRFEAEKQFIKRSPYV